MYTKKTSDYEKLYSLNVLGLEDRGENDQLDVSSEFRENIVKRSDGRCEVGVPWVSGTELSNTNEVQAENVLKRLRRNKDLKVEYEKIIHEQLEQGIVEKVPEQPTGSCVFYMNHKQVMRKRPQRQK